VRDDETVTMTHPDIKGEREFLPSQVEPFQAVGWKPVTKRPATTRATGTKTDRE